LRARLNERRTRPSVSDATDAELEKLEGSYEPVEPDEPGPRVAVDTAGEPELAVASALDQLGRVGVRSADAQHPA
jgi:hypothetical protein